MEKDFRIEKDSMGEVKVPSEALFGAQTERSLQHFSISDDQFPLPFIRCYILLKKAAALVNHDLGKLDSEKKDLIVKACQELLKDLKQKDFPLRIWQTGSGTQTNMNVNEVISNKAIMLAHGKLGSKDPIHPNDHVNMSQSSNDSFPTVMHLVTAFLTHEKLIPSLKKLLKALKDKEKEFHEVIKIGRTHLQDAVPLTLGQEFSGYATLIARNIERIEIALEGVYDLAIGATAVGTGLNAPKGFGDKMAAKLGELFNLPFKSHPCKFAALSSHDELLFFSGSLKTLAASLFKIANDIRFLGSGPRCGLSELILPENEPGSSIMPGKVNPTQCEALTMVAAQVMGADQAITFAGFSGHFELNVFKPMIIYNIIHAIDLISDSAQMFTKYCLEGLEANKEKLEHYVENSLMLVTALAPKIGYDKAAKIAHIAHEKNLSLKQAGIELGFITEKEYDDWVQPKKMI